MFDHPSYDQHEGIHAFHDETSGLKCLIAIHSTALGPAAGGCRMWDYASSDAMLTDVLRLSQGMSYKNAMAGIPHGGGKAVIWGDPKTQKSDALFRAFGQKVHSLQGKYYSAIDVGITVQDVEIIAQETPFVAGVPTTRSPIAGGSPSPITAIGVFKGIKATLARVFGTDDLNGRTIAVQGIGSVGGAVCQYLAEEGANLILTDIDVDAVADLAKHLGAKAVSPEEIYKVEADLFSPNALGGVINPDTIKTLKVKAIAGGANNQLLTPDMGTALSDAGILYAPDYVINGGGIINVASEISGSYSRDWVLGKVDKMVETLGNVLDEALSKGLPTHQVADEMARARISGRA